jgi:hypothetical protein
MSQKSATKIDSSSPSIEVEAGGKRKGIFSRLFNWKQKKNKIQQSPEEMTPGSHYVKV